MNKHDHRLGMDADISRRDFLNGVGVAIGSSLLPAASIADETGAQDIAGYYPPRLSGRRGSHPGSFEAAHMARDGAARTVTGGRVVMACYHTMIPMLCPEMPRDQRTALSNALRAPLVYTNVLIRNWTSFAKLGIRRASCPGCYHHGVTLDFPVSLGDYQCPKSPEEPMILHLTRVPIFPGLSAREQFAASKRELLATSFATFERNIREQLEGMLSAGGFESARDIAGITVNRWPHGYAYGYDPDTDRVAFQPSQWPAERRHWLRARERLGNISVAATDAAANAMTESAIVEAHRAIWDSTPSR